MRLLVATLALGAALNAFGWAGNVFLLGGLWDAAGAAAPPPLRPPYPSLVREALTFLSDFVFAFVLVCVYRLARPAWRGRPVGLALAAAVLVWLAGVPMTYLGMVNSGYLPVDVSVATTILALVGFILAAPLLPALLPYKESTDR